MRKSSVTAAVVSAAALFTFALAPLQAEDKKEEKKPVQILFKNVNVFNGFDDKLDKNMSVLVEANYIKEVGATIHAPDAYVVDGEGRTMTPGLIDMHQHIMLNPPEGTAAYQTR
jgi:imidazolonepropionase-like amidohydrolase